MTDLLNRLLLTPQASIFVIALFGVTFITISAKLGLELYRIARYFLRHGKDGI